MFLFPITDQPPTERSRPKEQAMRHSHTPYTTQLPKTARAFRSSNGQTIVYLDSLPDDGQVLFSPDGQNYFVLMTQLFWGTASEHAITFVNPHNETHGFINCNGDTIECIGNLYTGVDCPEGDLIVVPLPPDFFKRINSITNRLSNPL